MKIKRSMAVHPHPIVYEDSGRARYPTAEERGVREWGEEPPWHGAWGYRITRVTNSTEYRPGLPLTKADVDHLIEEGWTVSVLSG